MLQVRSETRIVERAIQFLNEVESHVIRDAKMAVKIIKELTWKRAKSEAHIYLWISFDLKDPSITHHHFLANSFRHPLKPSVQLLLYRQILN